MMTLEIHAFFVFEIFSRLALRFPRLTMRGDSLALTFLVLSFFWRRKIGQEWEGCLLSLVAPFFCGGNWGNGRKGISSTTGLTFLDGRELVSPFIVVIGVRGKEGTTFGSVWAVVHRMGPDGTE